ncbi:MAG: hypothetical protein QW507_01855 [Candidatus Nanoarchaeia archaeon]|nr:hypothetical protein [Candidatus Haiyanarchaeum thermophilum]MCW1302842.1 hypothetical protein [Candidatus Haiyanarchaeum thermophilum]MCW1303522.1 hypothetical protein [Candidatus Haiyanarchaeum thermophilum]MCW1306702.1 hypothetical protein [Candidatus Haiyanarchaeum thermophilum]MCW1307342.1 hypothetical protein [Candidatus Haiyanarchaeum thermophilum]
MTGPAVGKILLNNCRIFIVERKRKECEGEVYIHVKGFALARVTHLDIEAPELEQLLKNGKFLSISGIVGGIRIKVMEGVWIEVVNPLLNDVLKIGERTRTWVGVKSGGIYIGFRKKHIEKLEALARKLGFVW